MPFRNRQEAQIWSQSQRLSGPCGVLICSGGFRHRFSMEPEPAGARLYYIGMG